MKEIEEIKSKLEKNKYISNEQIDTTLFLAFALKKPILIETNYQPVSSTGEMISCSNDREIKIWRQVIN